MAIIHKSKSVYMTGNHAVKTIFVYPAINAAAKRRGQEGFKHTGAEEAFVICSTGTTPNMEYVKS